MQKHSHLTPEGRAFWHTERLWELAKDLPVVLVRVDSIGELDQNCWFVDAPTCREVADHARRIYEADLNQPIILAAEGHLMDGGHRLSKAYLLGISEVRAKQFVRTPEPDYVERQ